MRPPFPWEEESDGSEAFAWLAIIFAILFAVVMAIAIAELVGAVG